MKLVVGDEQPLAIIAAILMASRLRMDRETAFVFAESYILDARKMVQSGGKPPQGEVSHGR